MVVHVVVIFQQVRCQTLSVAPPLKQGNHCYFCNLTSEESEAQKTEVTKLVSSMAGVWNPGSVGFGEIPPAGPVQPNPEACRRLIRVLKLARVTPLAARPQERPKGVKMESTSLASLLCLVSILFRVTPCIRQVEEKASSLTVI